MIERAKAIFDPIRLQMIKLLEDREMCVCDITEVLQLSQPRASQHLRILKRAGLVIERRQGKWVYYQANLTALREFIAAFERFMTSPDGGIPGIGERISHSRRLRCEPRCL